jgi:hypothetical protein
MLKRTTVLSGGTNLENVEGFALAGIVTVSIPRTDNRLHRTRCKRPPAMDTLQFPRETASSIFRYSNLSQRATVGRVFMDIASARSVRAVLAE